MALFDEKRVLTYGTFDQFTPSHLGLLRRLSTLGQKLIVGLASDELSRQRGCGAIAPYDVRKEILGSCRYVHQVICQNDPEQCRTDVVNYNISLLAMDESWAGAFDYVSDLTQVIYLHNSAAVETYQTQFPDRLRA